MPTAIEWTDETYNPIRARDRTTGKVGHFCEKLSPGCAHCYASALQWRWHGHEFLPTNRDKVELFLDDAVLGKPLSWKKPRKVFVCDMTDLFYEGHDDATIDRVFAVMALCRRHTFQVLTKRADRMRDHMTSLGRSFARLKAACPVGWTMEFEGLPLVPWPLPNVWLGVSAENQKFADERIPHLLNTPAAVRFVSVEPLLSAVDLSAFFGGEYVAVPGDHVEPNYNFGIDWVIVGGESGSGARLCDLAWIRSLSGLCRAASVPLFVKQIGRNPLWAQRDVAERWHEQLSHSKGGDPAEWPADLRVREFPK